MAPGAPPAPPASPYAFPDALLPTLLAVSLSAVNLLSPVYGPDGSDIVDFTLDYLNPAAQRMAGLPEQPGTTALTRFPEMVATGVFDFYRRAYAAGTPETFEVNYQADGLDNFFRLAAQRHQALLVVSFTDTADQPRTAVEVALRESQTRERAARAEAEHQRGELERLFEQAPVALAVFRGPRHVVELANPEVLRMWGRTPAQALHTPLFELLPEISGQGFEELLAGVLATGTPYVAHEMPGLIDREGRRDTVYWNFVYQPLRGAEGQVEGVTVVAVEVSEQVGARRQVEQLNQELEARVFERTQAQRHAQTEAVTATQRLRHVTDSLPSTSFTVDQSGKVRYISPQWYAYTGMALDAPINKVWPTLIHPDDLPAIAHEFGAALAEGRPWRYEFRLRGAAGQYRWFASQGVPEPLEEAEAAGRPRQWFGSNLDIDDLQQAQHTLEQQDRRLRELLLQSPAMIAALTGPEHRFAFTNPGYDALAGHRAVPGRSVAECLPEVVGQGFIDLLDRVYRTGEPYLGHETPIELQAPGGVPTTHYLDFTYQPLRDAHGQTTGVQAFVLDATERVRARQGAERLQAELLAAAERQAQERAAFHEVFEHTPACIALLRGPEHRFEFVNRAYQDLFPGRELVGHTLAQALPDAADQGFVALLDGVYRTGETFFGNELPLAITQPDGRLPRQAYFTFTYQAYREHGPVVGISIFAYDVTEQVLARQERDAERQQLHELFMQAPAPIVILDGPELVFQLINPAYQRIFPGRDLLNKPLLEALPELVGTPIPDLFQGVYQTGEPVTLHELPLRMPRHEGRPPEDIYWTFTYQARRDAHGRIDGVRVFAHDVTDQVQARRVVEEDGAQASALAEQLRMANTQLTRTNVDLDNFIYTASHDLKAPISNIEGLLDTLRDELPPLEAGGEVAYILELMQDSVNRFTRTIEHLTDVSRLQKEHDQPHEPVPLAGIIEDVRLDLAPLLQQTGGRLDIDVRAVPTVQFSVKTCARWSTTCSATLSSTATPTGCPSRRCGAGTKAPTTCWRCRTTAWDWT
ncbi:hypothetical protein AXW84_00015 (plasmid) [Hymenobacter sp. PAMC 26628]|nr:hypothetical protein AXW84_00015 [Hymenobacter sp. PAMC 26628]